MARRKFLISLTTNENDYQIEQADSAAQAARKLGLDAQIIYADNDAVNQSTQLLKAIQADPEARPDAIVFEPVSGTALPQVARAAAGCGIDWAVLNREATYISELRRASKASVFGVSSDHIEIGRIQGRQFAALLPKGGTELYIHGPSENSAAKERTLGMQETKPANIQLVMLKGQWTEESAQRAVQSWLKLTTSQKTQIDLVGAQNDAMAVGARKTSRNPSGTGTRTLAQYSFHRLRRLAKNGAVLGAEPDSRGDHFCASQQWPGNGDACGRHPEWKNSRGARVDGSLCRCRRLTLCGPKDNRLHFCPTAPFFPAYNAAEFFL